MTSNSTFEFITNQENTLTGLKSGYFSSFDSSYLDLESESSGSVKIVGCRKRKNFIPQKSSYLNDPTFQGVTIRMENKLINGEWRLIMTPTFSLHRKKRIFKPYPDSSDEEEISNNYTSSNEDQLWLVNKKTGNFAEKHCASCSAKKTPLWRDAEDGTPLCNACGIRYKKYRMRCETCWHIPKKDEFHPRCRSCGSSYVSPRR